jgi:hypothetical protein
VTRSFQVKKNETTVVEVTFEPKVAAKVQPAVYRVTVDPPDAIVTASGEGVSKCHRQRRRTHGEGR